MPGLALLHLARGEVGDAQRAIERALATASGTGALSDRATRGRLLPAQVDIALAAGDLDTARLAVEELESIAADFERPLFRAGALTARGELLLGEDKPTEASPILGQSWRLWRTTDLPYESARARLALRRGAGSRGRRGDRAAGPARRARRVRAARRDARPASGSMRCSARSGGQPATPRPADRRATKTFMFTDIVTSTDLVGVIGDEAWNELLAGTTASCARPSRSTAARWSTTPATASSLPSNERPTRSTARSTSSAGSCATAASTASRRRSGSGSTRPRRPAGVATTPGRASTSPLGWAPRRDASEILATAAVLAGSRRRGSRCPSRGC